MDNLTITCTSLSCPERTGGKCNAIEQIEKAFGGCKKCYGKGYATYRHSITDGDMVTKPETKIVPCVCDRGKQLTELLKDTDKLDIGIT